MYLKEVSTAQTDPCVPAPARATQDSGLKDETRERGGVKTNVKVKKKVNLISDEVEYFLYENCRTKSDVDNKRLFTVGIFKSVIK